MHQSLLVPWGWGGGGPVELGGYQSSLTQYKDFNLKTIEK